MKIGLIGRRGSGKIVNMASITVEDGTPEFLLYVASKPAIIGLTRSMARELGCDGIAQDDHGLHPARQGLRDAAVGGAQRLDRGRSVLQAGAWPQELVGTLVYLASLFSGFVSGQNIRVNGGRRFA